MEVLFFYLFVILDALTLCGCVCVLVTPLFHVLTITWRTHPRVLEYSFTVTCSDRNDGHDVQTGILKVHTTAETGLPTGASVTVLKSPTRFPRRFLWKFRKSALPRATKSTFRCRGGHPTMQCSGFDKGLQDTVVRNLISFLLKPEAESLFLDVRRILHQNNHCVLFTAGQKVLVCFRWKLHVVCWLGNHEFRWTRISRIGLSTKSRQRTIQMWSVTRLYRYWALSAQKCWLTGTSTSGASRIQYSGFRPRFWMVLLLFSLLQLRANTTTTASEVVKMVLWQMERTCAERGKRTRCFSENRPEDFCLVAASGPKEKCFPDDCKPLVLQNPWRRGRLYVRLRSEALAASSSRDQFTSVWL